ncbi:MAG TPA: DPP IV N-terminal domain-containing protein, partial [Blastocatellia bacterium]
MKKYTLWLSLILILAAGSAHAQKRGFTIEDIYRIKSISDVHISPDGKSIVYSVATPDLPRAKRVTQIWVMDIDGRNARQITEGDKSSTSPLWSPDGKWISFISSKDDSANLYVMPARGGEARKITNVATGVYDPLWSPDSRWLAFSTDVYPECGGDDACNKRTAETWANGPLKAHMADDLLYRHWDSWKDGTRTHIFVASAQTGEVRDVTPGNFDSPTFQLSGPLQYDFSPDS